jgi:titin
LINGTAYSFRIAAHNALGWSAPTAVVNAAPRTVPTQPLSLVASAGKEMVALIWAAPTATGGAPIDSYVVRRATAPGGPWTDVAHPNVLGYFDFGLTAGTTYWFQVAAHNAAGFGAPSISASAVPVTVPGPPTQLTATPLNDQLTLSWHAPWSDGGVVHGVLPGKTYYFRILAHNAVGWGSSAYGSVTVPPKVPGVPATCAAVQLGGNGSTTARITWSPPVSDGGSPILFYRVTAIKYNGPTVMQTALWGPITTYDADLPTGDPWARYEIYVEAFNKVGVGPVCDVPVWMYDKDF